VDEAAGADLIGRTHREAPEIDGIVRVEGAAARPGAVVTVEITGALGPDLLATPAYAGAVRP
jgi:ribosomal protein S12 methylthiotransferase